MDFRTPGGQQQYDALVAAADRTVVGLDFDGVLAPIVDDPASATIHPQGLRMLVDLAAEVRAVAVITGRPARQAVQLGTLDEVADGLGRPNLFVLGQYGNERWSAQTREFRSPAPPEGLSPFLEELPDLLAALGAADAFVEHKEIAVAVHTRRLPDPQAVFDRVLPVLTAAAEAHRLGVEPGRQVVEIRGPGMHKGDAVRSIRREVGADGVLFAGDDLGDVEAFRMVATLRQAGSPGLLVCSGSEEQKALVELSDIVVDGPAGVLGLLAKFVADTRAGQ